MKKYLILILLIISTVLHAQVFWNINKDTASVFAFDKKKGVFIVTKYAGRFNKSADSLHYFKYRKPEIKEYNNSKVGYFGIDTVCKNIDTRCLSIFYNEKWLQTNDAIMFSDKKNNVTTFCIVKEESYKGVYYSADNSKTWQKMDSIPKDKKLVVKTESYKLLQRGARSWNIDASSQPVILINEKWKYTVKVPDKK